MEQVKISVNKLDSLAQTVSSKSGAALPLTIDEMNTAVDSIQTGGGGNMQTKAVSYTPAETAISDTVTPSTGYDGLSEVDVTVGAISSSYVGSAINRNDSTDLTASGATVTAPAGYYENSASKSVASGTEGTPTATKGTVSNHAIAVTPSVTNSEGYISGGTKTGTAVSVSASEVTSGNKAITNNGNNIDVVNYATVSVNVSGGAPALQTKSETYTPTESQQTDSITADVGYDGLDEVNITVEAIDSEYVGSDVPRKSSSDLTASGATVTAPAGYYSAQATKTIASGSATTPTTTITAYPTISISNTGLIESSVSATEAITPTVSAGYVSSGTAGNVTASGYANTQLTVKTSSDLTASGATVTAPAGYYTASASKSVASGTAGTPIATKGTVSNHAIAVTPSVTNTTGYITGGTKTGTAVSVSASEVTSGNKSITSNGTNIDVTNYATVSVAVPGSSPALETITKTYTPSTSSQSDTITASTGYDAIEEVDVTINAMPSGSATGPSSVSSTGATVSTPQANTLTLSKSNVSITPVVSAGYVSSGTASSATVTLSAAVPLKGATTYTPTTSDQTIASGTYLTGAQTISGDANLVAGNIKKNVSIFGVTGSYEGSGGGGITTLLTTYSVGSVSTTSTQEVDISKSFSFNGLNDYDGLIIEVKADSSVNGAHLSTTRFAWLTNQTNIATKNTSSVATATLNSKLSSTGVVSSRSATTVYGVYPKSVSLSSGTGTIALYAKYSSTYTGTINNTYTAKVWGIKLFTP